MNPIVLLESPENKDLKPSKYIDHMCHNTPGDSTSGKYIIKIQRLKGGLSLWT